jgi:Asp-tRNA(Asn)/Glu-tRNA(Gln) amidotransferase A subunit family amidase
VRAAGAIVTAKTNVPEFGAGANSRNPVWGATGNPFDPTLIAGGSSGGSAAALACDMLPLCTDRIPADRCGCRRRSAASSASALLRVWCR